MKTPRTAKEWRKLIGSRLEYWDGDFRRVGTLEEVIRKNLRFHDDWRWAPQITLIRLLETAEEAAHNPQEDKT